MTYDQIISFYGTIRKSGEALKVSRQTLFNWRRFGISIERQIQIELQTGGQLRADLPQAIRTGIPS